MKIAVTLFLLFASLQTMAYPLNPNPQTQPGSLCNRQNPDYAGDRYPEHIAYCRRNVDSGLKKALYDAYAVPEQCRSRYTIDHLIPLSIGGDNSPENLWPEHKLVKQTRPQLEQQVFEDLRDARITQQEAINRVYYAKMQTIQVLAGSGDLCDQ